MQIQRNAGPQPGCGERDIPPLTANLQQKQRRFSDIANEVWPMMARETVEEYFRQ